MTFALILVIPRTGAAAFDCSAIDPTGVLARITGDFELSADPDDPQGGVLLTSNADKRNVSSNQNVVVARLDGTTGMVVPGSLTVIANNFYGDSGINGPEWFRSPQGSLGVIYPTQGGLALALRSPPPTAWNAFNYDYTGAPTNGSPPPLPNAIPGTYVVPPLQPPTTESDYAGFGGGCTSMCFANYQGGLATDVGKVLAPQGYSVTTAQPATWDGYIYYSACKAGSGCGLFTAAVDGKGGLSAQTQVASTGAQAVREIVSYVHPVTGQVVVFTTQTATSIAVFTQATPGAPLTMLASVPVQRGPIHFRTIASATQVVMNFFVEPASGVVPGDYTIAVSAANGALSVGPANLINFATGTAELTWYPAGALWRVVNRSGTQFYGCTVTP